jgi:hypothetical protein
MPITIDLPPDLEASLRHGMNDLNASAKEAVLVDLYCRGALSQSQLARALGVTLMESDAVLKRHHVYYEMTAADVAAESDSLRRLRNDHAHRR